MKIREDAYSKFRYDSKRQQLDMLAKKREKTKRHFQDQEMTVSEISSIVKSDTKFGMDHIYRVNLRNEHEQAFRIVAPFVDHVLNSKMQMIQMPQGDMDLTSEKEYKSLPMSKINHFTPFDQHPKKSRNA